MTVPPGPDQPQRGYGARPGQPQDAPGGTPVPPGQSQGPGQGVYGEQAPLPQLPPPSSSQPQPQQPPSQPQPGGPGFPGQSMAPQYQGGPGQQQYQGYPPQAMPPGAQGIPPLPPQHQGAHPFQPQLQGQHQDQGQHQPQYQGQNQGQGQHQPQYQGQGQHQPQHQGHGQQPSQPQLQPQHHAQHQPPFQPPAPPYGSGAFAPPQASGYGWPQLQPAPATHFNPAMLLPIQHWLRDKSLRNWITMLFVALVVVPSIALVYVGDDASKISKSTWAFAIYFACAWLLVLWISIRPPMVRPLMLLEVGAIGLLVEAPMAIWLEKKLETPNLDLATYIFRVGLPEEFVKILPVVVLGLLLKQVWGPLTPKDYLFLGAVSGLAFGAAEAVQYINVYIPAQSASIAVEAAQQNADPSSLGQFIAMTSIQSGSWRFVTDPMSHAVWAGITGYFVGLAFQHRRYFWLALVGLGITSLLHGINDDVAGHWFWIVEIVVSVLLFMAYVQAGGVIEQQLTEADEAHARAHPHPGYPMPVPGGMPAPGWGAPAAAAPPAPGWAPTGYGTGSMPVAPSWNPAAGWGQSGFTPIRGYRGAAPVGQAPSQPSSQPPSQSPSLSAPPMPAPGPIPPHVSGQQAPPLPPPQQER